jgi:MFS_1 like family
VRKGPRGTPPATKPTGLDRSAGGLPRGVGLPNYIQRTSRVGRSDWGTSVVLRTVDPDAVLAGHPNHHTNSNVIAAPPPPRMSPPVVPAFPARAGREPSAEIAHRPWLTLLRQRAFVHVTLVCALVLGSHAMYDSFAVIRWTQAGISTATISVLWSESVAAEVLVFLFLGPRLLRRLKPTIALAIAALCGLVRWAVLAQTADVVALALVQPLHGFTFALLYLASMNIIADTVPRALAATAQAVYGLVGVGRHRRLILLSGWLYARFGPAGFWAMGLLCMAAFPFIWLLHRIPVPSLSNDR